MSAPAPARPPEHGTIVAQNRDFVKRAKVTIFCGHFGGGFVTKSAQITGLWINRNKVRIKLLRNKEIFP